jgi:hypothetical protein
VGSRVGLHALKGNKSLALPGIERFHRRPARSLAVIPTALSRLPRNTGIKGNHEIGKTQKS